MRKAIVFVCLCVVGCAGFCQYSLTGPAYTQSFQSLPGVSTTVPGGDMSVLSPLLAGWYFLEAGSAANMQLNAGDGSSSTGDTWQFGSPGNSDPSIGMLRSASLQSMIGFHFMNNTGGTITSLDIRYAGEQWRLGTANRMDRLEAQYSLNATQLNNGIWVDADSLDLLSPVNSLPTGMLNGNLPQNRRIIHFTLRGIKLHPGQSFFIRWTDYDATGAEDGLAIDDFELTAGFAPRSQHYFRTAGSGPWNETATWESSPDMQDWAAAADIPCADASSITIRNGDTVKFSSFTEIDELIIEGGGFLDFDNGIMHVRNGPGDDVIIHPGAVFNFSSASNFPSLESGAMILVDSSGILKISSNGHTTTAGGGVHSPGISYRNHSVLEYTLSTPFGSNGITYFPHADAGTIPVFRIMNTISLPIGAAGSTTINGILEVNSNISFNGSGAKNFRNGFAGSGNISASGTGKFIINGESAILDGTGQISLPPNGMEIAAGTEVALKSDKQVNGNLFLKGEEAIISLNNANLSVSGSVNNESNSSYVRTNGSGALIMLSPSPSTFFPVGNSSYNPVTFTNALTGQLSVRVIDSVSSISVPGSVINRTWELSGSVEHPDLRVKFQFSDVDAGPGILVTDQMDVLINSGAWNIIPGNSGITPSSEGQGMYSINSPSSVPLSTFPGNYILAKSGSQLLALGDDIKLSGRISGGMISLEWVTERSAGFVDFVVEQFLNGVWRSSGQVAAARYGTVYTFEIPAGRMNGVVLYRIRANKNNGTVVYSPVLSLRREQDLQEMKIFPNPVKDRVTVNLNCRGPVLHIRLIDLAGRTIRRLQVNVRPAYNTIHLPVEYLSPGLYCIVVENEDIKPGLFTRQ